MTSLDPECNPNTPGGQHHGGCEAAVAVRLARAEGRADAMEAWLFANQPSLSRESIRAALADVAGVTTFDEAYDRVLAEVRSDVALGGRLEVAATPTFFVNGIRIQGGLQPAYFERLLELEVKRARS